jgi:flagellar motor switch protein FliN
MPVQATPGTALWIAETWAARLAESIETMTGERPRAEAKALESAGSLDGALWWGQPLSVRLEASMWVGAPEVSWLAIGRHTLASAGIDSTEPADARNTFLEISSQALSGLSQSLSALAGKPITCENGAEAAGPGAGAEVFEIGLALAGAPELALRLCVAPVLVESIAAIETGKGSLELRQNSVPAAFEDPGRDRQRAGRGGQTLDLLMEVELPVSVSFGRADLPLKDVLKLTTGSIVELNRVLTEPVEVIVNNCVIARGEVVVIDWNYGVRIQEIISRDSRLRTLR